MSFSARYRHRGRLSRATTPGAFRRSLWLGGTTSWREPPLHRMYAKSSRRTVQLSSQSRRSCDARTYPRTNDGTYCQEPVFGDLLRTARALGYSFVAYEIAPSLLAKHDPAQTSDEMKRPEQRLIIEARGANEPDDAVPVDRIMNDPGEELPLLLRPGSYSVRAKTLPGEWSAYVALDVP